MQGLTWHGHPLVMHGSLEPTNIDRERQNCQHYHQDPSGMIVPSVQCRGHSCGEKEKKKKFKKCDQPSFDPVPENYNHTGDCEICQAFLASLKRDKETKQDLEELSMEMAWKQVKSGQEALKECGEDIDKANRNQLR